MVEVLAVLGRESGSVQEEDKVPEVKDKDMVEHGTAEEKLDTQYVISEGYRGAVARLHSRTGCYRGRNLSFKSYEIVDGVPSANAFTDFCRSCWPRSGPGPDFMDAEGVISEVEELDSDGDDSEDEDEWS